MCSATPDQRHDEAGRVFIGVLSSSDFGALWPMQQGMSAASITTAVGAGVTVQ